MSIKIKEIQSPIIFDVEYKGYNFHLTFSYDLKEFYEFDDVTVDSDFGEKYPPTSEERQQFVSEMVDKVQYAAFNNQGVEWIN